MKAKCNQSFSCGQIHSRNPACCLFVLAFCCLQCSQVVTPGAHWGAGGGVEAGLQTNFFHHCPGFKKSEKNPNVVSLLS